MKVTRTNSVIQGSVKPKAIPEELLNKHYRRPIERPFYKDERSTTTLLLGGLSSTHDRLIAASLRNLGLKAEALPSTNISAYEVGREFGNNGYCNPTYFTVGNLIKYLKDLEADGLSKEEIIEQYAFLTAGCNAPCRFGLIEIEYRMALKDAGFHGFRVLVFKKEDGLSQSVRGVGIEITPRFFLVLVNAINIADIIIGHSNEIRPKELEEGSTDKVKEKAILHLCQALENRKAVTLKPVLRKLGRWLEVEDLLLHVSTFINQLTSKELVYKMREVSTWFKEIKVDPLRPKTIVKITGELWAGTTEGDGNFNMHKFLEKEGAIVLVEPVATYILFMLNKHLLRIRDRKEVIINKGVSKWHHFLRYLNNCLIYFKKVAILKLGTKLYTREYLRLARELSPNLILVDQTQLQALAHKYYHTHIEGGEGFMEVAKNIYYHTHHKCHMVLSLKPFGCMPSTQSDGVQAAVMEHHKHMIFLPVETSGEGGTNAHNRVLMALTEARHKLNKEVSEALNKTRLSWPQLKRIVFRNEELTNAGYVVPKREGVASKTASFIYHVDDLLKQAG